MLGGARSMVRDLNTVRQLSSRLAWEGGKLVAFLALKEGVQRVLSGPLEVRIDTPPLLRVGEPFDASVTVTAPFELTEFQVFWEDRWRAGETNGVGRRTERWRLIPHTLGLRPLTAVVRDAEGHRLRKTRWVPVLPARAAVGLAESPLDVGGGKSA